LTAIAVFGLSAMGRAALAGTEPGDRANLGRLLIQGEGIQRLVLEGRSGVARTITTPGAMVELPADEYRLQQVELTGGFKWQLRGVAAEPWVKVGGEASARLFVGAPLRSEVQVQPGGGCLNMSYRLVDCEGRDYLNSKAPAPRVTVYKGDRELTSQTLKYG
jgi:hypothetical protein